MSAAIGDQWARLKSQHDISDTVLLMGPCVSLGFGKPDLDTGGVSTGYGLKDDGGDLAITQYSSAGVGTEMFRMTAGGAMRFRDLGGDPSAPPAGYVDVFCKSGDIDQIDAGSIVTQLTN